MPFCTPTGHSPKFGFPDSVHTLLACSILFLPEGLENGTVRRSHRPLSSGLSGSGAWASPLPHCRPRRPPARPSAAGWERASGGSRPVRAHAALPVCPRPALRLPGPGCPSVPLRRAHGGGAGPSAGVTRGPSPRSLRHRPPGDVHGAGPYAARPARSPLPGALHTDDKLRPGALAQGAGHVLDGQRLCGEYQFAMTVCEQ